MSNRMSPTKGNESAKKPKKKAPKKTPEIQTRKEFQSDSDLSISTPGETISDLRKEFNCQVTQIKADFENQLNLIKADFRGQTDALHRVINDKDTLIGALQKKVGELEKSLDYLHNETSENNKKIDHNTKHFESEITKTNQSVFSVKEKAVDLEDRSRRSNLVFYNFPEAEDGEEDNCERRVYNLLENLGIFPRDHEIWMDRAHRLGKKRTGNDVKPRPIIVKFTYYKQKQQILNSGSKFRHCPVNVSEDFSRETLEVHKKLFNHGKAAKMSYNDSSKSIIKFKVNYRRLVMTYTLNKSDARAKTVTRSFSLDNIKHNPDWYKLIPRAVTQSDN